MMYRKIWCGMLIGASLLCLLVGFVGYEMGQYRSARDRMLRDWDFALWSSRIATNSSAKATSSPARLLRTWKALDTMRMDYLDAVMKEEGQLKATIGLLADNERHSSSLLAAFRGLLESEGMSFRDFLALRAYVAGQIKDRDTGKDGAFFLDSVREQQESVQNLGVRIQSVGEATSVNPDDKELNDLIEYLRSGKRKSLVWERWVTLGGIHHLLLMRARDP